MSRRRISPSLYLLHQLDGLDIDKFSKEWDTYLEDYRKILLLKADLAVLYRELDFEPLLDRLKQTEVAYLIRIMLEGNLNVKRGPLMFADGFKRHVPLMTPAGDNFITQAVKGKVLLLQYSKDGISTFVSRRATSSTAIYPPPNFTSVKTERPSVAIGTVSTAKGKSFSFEKLLRDPNSRKNDFPLRYKTKDLVMVNGKWVLHLKPPIRKKLLDEFFPPDCRETELEDLMLRPMANQAPLYEPRTNKS